MKEGRPKKYKLNNSVYIILLKCKIIYSDRKQISGYLVGAMMGKCRKDYKGARGNF